MKIQNGVNLSKNLNKQVSFKGNKQVMDEVGLKKHKFFLPYDSDKYTAEVQLYNVEKDKNGNYTVNAKNEPVKTIALDENGNGVETLDAEQEFMMQDKFAYRFKLTPKNGGEPVYVHDAGTTTNLLKRDENGKILKDGWVDVPDKAQDNKFNIVFTDRAALGKDGKMQLIMVDQYYPGMEKDADGNFKVNQALRNKALGSVRTHTNKLGGDFNGVMAKLPELEKEGYTRIVGMPFTKDTISSHLYWTQNAYQVSPNLGSSEDFKDLQKSLFKHGINWVADAALVNEGLQGVHFSNVLKWGKESPYYNWFKSNGLDNGTLSLGVLPKNTENVRFKLVNSPFLAEKGMPKNPNYDSTKPTFVQLYDNRLASEEQKTDNNIISNYANNNPENSYDITSHNDTVYPYSFEINPDVLKDNINKYSERVGEKFDLQNIETIKEIMNFENFKIAPKAEGGFELWDGNTDIAKLNFYYGNMDQETISKMPPAERKLREEEFKRGVSAVQDYAVMSGKYWTKNTADIQTEAATQSLKNLNGNSDEVMKRISDEVKKGNLPKLALEAMSKDVVENVLDGNYAFRRTEGPAKADDFILKEMMDLPLEVLPVATDLAGVLCSPFISKKASTPDEVGVSRYDVHKNGNPNIAPDYKNIYEKADKIYTKDMLNFANKTLDAVANKTGMKLKENGELTELGKYVVKEIMPDVTQFALVKGLDKNADIKYSKDGSLNFANVNADNITLGSLGIKGNSPKNEAEMLVGKLSKGINSISANDINELINSLAKRIEGKDVNTYRLAEVLIDRTESGLGWRIDAAKDVSSIDAVRANKDDIDRAWSEAVKFWKNFNQNVVDINPHSYTTAEITDLADFLNQKVGKYDSQTDAETKFIEETGITTIANYSYFFSLIPGMYTRNAEGGWQSGDFGNVSQLQQKMDGINSGWGGNPGFEYVTPLDGVLHSYTFVGNHDKPRMLHTLAVDMELFYSDFKSPEHKKAAAYVLGKSEKEIESIGLDNVNSKAIAAGLRMKQAFADVVKDKETLDKINAAIEKLAGGEFKGKNFNAEAFGVRPFEIVIKNILEQADYMGGLNVKDRDKLEADVLGNILKPAFDKYYTIYKTLVTLPGDVTDFGGDKVASTGFESKAKNYYQQNRNTINWEWLDDPNRKYVKEFRDNVNNILGLRNNPKLSALNDGVPVSMALVKGKEAKTRAGNNGPLELDIYPLLRYNDKDSVTLTLYNTSGANRETQYDPMKERQNRQPLDRIKVTVDEIPLSSQNGDTRQGLAGGIKQGTTFKSTRQGDDSNYKVCVNSEGKYVLKRFNKDGVFTPITIEPQDLNALVLYKA